MSADLTWQIIRNNSCFLRRQRGIAKQFSVEKFNLKGKNSPRYNGLINNKAVDVSVAADGKGVVVSTKVAGKHGLPAKSVTAFPVKNAMKALRTIKRVTKSQNLGAQTKLAQRRASVFLRSQQPKSKKYAKKTEA